VFGAVGQPGAGHALAQAALFQEISLQAAELLVQQIIGHLDQAHDHIGADGRVGVLDALLEGG